MKSYISNTTINGNARYEYRESEEYVEVEFRLDNGKSLFTYLVPAGQRILLALCVQNRGLQELLLECDKDADHRRVARNTWPTLFRLVDNTESGNYIHDYGLIDIEFDGRTEWIVFRVYHANHDDEINNLLQQSMDILDTIADMQTELSENHPDWRGTNKKNMIVSFEKGMLKGIRKILFDWDLLK